MKIFITMILSIVLCFFGSFFYLVNVNASTTYTDVSLSATENNVYFVDRTSDGASAFFENETYIQNAITDIITNTTITKEYIIFMDWVAPRNSNTTTYFTLFLYQYDELQVQSFKSNSTATAREVRLRNYVGTTLTNMTMNYRRYLVSTGAYSSASGYGSQAPNTISIIEQSYLYGANSILNMPQKIVYKSDEILTTLPITTINSDSYTDMPVSKCAISPALCSESWSVGDNLPIDIFMEDYYNAPPTLSVLDMTGNHGAVFFYKDWSNFSMEIDYNLILTGDYRVSWFNITNESVMTEGFDLLPVNMNSLPYIDSLDNTEDMFELRNLLTNPVPENYVWLHPLYQEAYFFRNITTTGTPTISYDSELLDYRLTDTEGQLESDMLFIDSQSNEQTITQLPPFFIDDSSIEGYYNYYMQYLDTLKAKSVAFWNYLGSFFNGIPEPIRLFIMLTFILALVIMLYKALMK